MFSQQKKKSESGHTRGIMFQTEVNYRGLETAAVLAKPTKHKFNSPVCCLKPKGPILGTEGQVLSK